MDVPGGEESSKLLGARGSKDAPDAVNLVDIEVPQFADSLVDMSQYFTGDELADYPKGLLDAGRRKGQQLAIPGYHGGAPAKPYRPGAGSAPGWG